MHAFAGDVEKARKIFADGVKLYQGGDWEGARRLFREADAEHHAPAIIYNLGLAEEKLGHPQAAVDAYEAYLAESGAKGELSASAATAVAQIKSRSTRLRIESKPSGARLFVDGSPLTEPAPTTFLVSPGHHIIVAQAQGDGGWRAERDVEVKGAGDVLAVSLEAETKSPEPPAPVVPPPPIVDRPAPPPIHDTPPIQPNDEADNNRPDSLVWGAMFAIAPTYLLGVTTAGADNTKTGLSIVAGPLIELGYALTDKLEFGFHGFAGIGPDAKPSYAFMGGPGLTWKVTSMLWLGAKFIGGKLETKAHGVRYGTDLVFGTMLEASIVVIKKPGFGEWLFSLQPGFLLTEMSKDNTAFFFPFAFGFRAF